jgi:hypothetical protein
MVEVEEEYGRDERGNLGETKEGIWKRRNREMGDMEAGTG